MKKLLFIVAGLMASTTAFAVSTGTLTISGTVVAINDIVITPVNNTTLNIIGGETDRKVADVSETSNSSTGYKILMSSLNSSKLVNGSAATKSTAYKVSYQNGTYVSLTSSDQVVKTTSTSELVTDSSSVRVNVTAYATAPAGTYSDTITISIAAN